MTLFGKEKIKKMYSILLRLGWWCQLSVWVGFWRCPLSNTGRPSGTCYNYPKHRSIKLWIFGHKTVREKLSSRWETWPLYHHCENDAQRLRAGCTFSILSSTLSLSLFLSLILSLVRLPSFSFMFFTILFPSFRCCAEENDGWGIVSRAARFIKSWP